MLLRPLRSKSIPSPALPLWERTNLCEQRLGGRETLRRKSGTRESGFDGARTTLFFRFDGRMLDIGHLFLAALFRVGV
jgi:hypothetical protein